MFAKPWKPLELVLLVLFSLLVTVSANSQEQEKRPELKPKGLFKTPRAEVSSLMFQAKGRSAVTKEGYIFFVLILGNVEPDAPIACEDITYSLCDKSGNALKPVAFGFPMENSTSPISMVGELAKGKLKVEKKTEIALFFVGSTSLKEVSVKTPQGTDVALAISEKYEPPQGSRIGNVLSNGRINFLAPTSADNWSIEAGSK